MINNRLSVLLGALLSASGPFACQAYEHPAAGSGAGNMHFTAANGVGYMPSNGTAAIAPSLEDVEAEYERCNSEIIDVHLHLAGWFGNSAAPLLAEMDASYISKGVMLAVYGPVANPFSGDPNTVVEQIVNSSQGRIKGMASLNTTVPDWETQGEAELDRLATFLAKPGFVGGKVAAPHTCLPLNSEIMRDVVRTISMSPNPVTFLHMGTTPFCGPMGAFILGRPGCCAPEYVDPTYMEDLIQEYSNTTFILVHAGADFLPPTDEFYYNGSNVDASLSLAGTYDNVYLEISAFLRLDDESQKDVYPNDILEKIADAGLASKAIYGSDVNHAPNALASYLSTTIDKMIMAGFTEEERCMILSGNSMKVFNGMGSIDDASVSSSVIEDETVVSASKAEGEDIDSSSTTTSPKTLLEDNSAELESASSASGTLSTIAVVASMGFALLI